MQHISQDTSSAMTLLELNEIIGALVQGEATSGIWVTAETSDLSRKRHCYMELIQKDDSGNTVARSRAAIWAGSLYDIDAKFTLVTGQRLATGMKVLVRVTVTFHPVYGLLLVIDDINPEFTLGDVLRRRQEIIDRLTEEGIIDMNRTLPWCDPVQRIAVISAETAAGYGDFENQLHSNPSGIVFYTRLFPATMQGPAAAQSIIAALSEVQKCADFFDTVVIIRGGGSSDDLSCFENYDLAANIAQFPLPVIIGIGHERDITLLDYVAAMRVKTPTAAAEWLINRAQNLLTELQNIGNSIYATVTSLLTNADRYLAACEGQLPSIATSALDNAKHKVDNAALFLSNIANTRISPELQRLDSFRKEVVAAAENAVEMRKSALDAYENLVTALSPQSVLLRGYTITTVNGKYARHASDVSENDIITTHFADGTVNSKPIKNK